MWCSIFVWQQEKKAAKHFSVLRTTIYDLCEWLRHSDYRREASAFFRCANQTFFFFVENCKSILLEWTISLVIMARRQEANSLNKNKIFQAIFVWIFHRRVSGTDFIVSLLNDELAYHTEMAFLKIQNGAQDILLVAKAKEWVAMEGWIPEQYVYLHVYTFPWHAHAQ